LAENELAGLLGSFIPFAPTKSERRRAGDPRPSVEERYRNRAQYVQQFSHAARLLVERRLLLPEDAERMIAEAKRSRIVSAKKG
jgi:hypothetical protein